MDNLHTQKKNHLVRYMISILWLIHLIKYSSMLTGASSDSAQFSDSCTKQQVVITPWRWPAQALRENPWVSFCREKSKNQAGRGSTEQWLSIEPSARTGGWAREVWTLILALVWGLFGKYEHISVIYLKINIGLQNEVLVDYSWVSRVWVIP